MSMLFPRQKLPSYQPYTNKVKSYRRFVIVPVHSGYPCAPYKRPESAHDLPSPQPLRHRLLAFGGCFGYDGDDQHFWLWLRFRILPTAHCAHLHTVGTTSDSWSMRPCSV